MTLYTYCTLQVLLGLIYLFPLNSKSLKEIHEKLIDEAKLKLKEDFNDAYASGGIFPSPFSGIAEIHERVKDVLEYMIAIGGFGFQFTTFQITIPLCVYFPSDFITNTSFVN